MPSTRVISRLYDVGAVLIAGLGAYLALWTDSRPVVPGEAPAWWWVDLVGGIVAMVAVLGRRRHPVAVSISISVLGVVAVSVWLAAIVAGFAVAVRRPWPTAVALTVLGLAMGPLQDLFREPTSAATSWGTVGWSIVISAAVIASGVAVRARHELMDSLVERAERAETEAALRAEAARAAERTRIAREMHDVLAHRLSMVSLHAGALAHRRHASPTEVHDALEVIRAGARDALTDLRAILGVLRDPDEERADADEAGSRAPQPTLADLDHLVDGVRAAGTPVRLRDERAGGALPDECGRTLYRITQEALTNAARHAPGQPVDILLRGAPGADAELEVSNPLTATIPAARPGNGLLGIAERVDLAGGTVLARGPEDDRFRVAVRVPWPDGVRSVEGG